MAKMLFRLPKAAKVFENPSPDEVKELAAKMPNAKPTQYGNLNVQTDVVSRSKRSTFIVTDEPDGQNQAITREEGLKWAEAQDAYIAGREMVQIDGYIGNDPEFRTPARLFIEAANANIAAMQQQLYFDPDGDVPRAGADRRLHAEPEGRGLSGRPADRRRPRAGRDAGLQLGLLRRVEEGRAPDVEQARSRPRRAAAARRLQDHPHAPRPPRRPDRRALRDGEDDDDLHAPERIAPGPGRLRRLDARRPDHGDRERLLREDVRPQPRRRADDPRRGHAARLVPRERLAARRRTWTSTTRATRRTDARPSRSA